MTSLTSNKSEPAEQIMSSLKRNEGESFEEYKVRRRTDAVLTDRKLKARACSVVHPKELTAANRDSFEYVGAIPVYEPFVAPTGQVVYIKRVKGTPFRSLSRQSRVA